VRDSFCMSWVFSTNTALDGRERGVGAASNRNLPGNSGWSLFGPLLHLGLGLISFFEQYMFMYMYHS
jgi:hypothetical protein